MSKKPIKPVRAPARIKHALDLLTNAAEKIEGLTNILPGTFTGIVTVLLKIFNLAVSLAAARPVPDLVMSLAPGLAAQGRVGNNGEIERLRRCTGNAASADRRLEYSAIMASFESAAGWWDAVHNAFLRPGATAAGFGASLVFPGGNDLVVDTECMNQLADRRLIANFENFGGAGAAVYHTNYFCQRQTVEFIRRTFGVPS